MYSGPPPHSHHIYDNSEVYHREKLSRRRRMHKFRGDSPRLSPVRGIGDDEAAYRVQSTFKVSKKMLSPRSDRHNRSSRRSLSKIESTASLHTIPRTTADLQHRMTHRRDHMLCHEHIEDELEEGYYSDTYTATPPDSPRRHSPPPKGKRRHMKRSKSNLEVTGRHKPRAFRVYHQYPDAEPELPAQCRVIDGSQPWNMRSFHYMGSNPVKDFKALFNMPPPVLVRRRKKKPKRWRQERDLRRRQDLAKTLSAKKAQDSKRYTEKARQREQRRRERERNKKKAIKEQWKKTEMKRRTSRSSNNSNDKENSNTANDNENNQTVKQNSDNDTGTGTKGIVVDVPVPGLDLTKARDNEHDDSNKDDDKDDESNSYNNTANDINDNEDSYRSGDSKYTRSRKQAWGGSDTYEGRHYSSHSHSKRRSRGENGSRRRDSRDEDYYFDSNAGVGVEEPDHPYYVARREGRRNRRASQGSQESTIFTDSDDSDFYYEEEWTHPYYHILNNKYGDTDVFKDEAARGIEHVIASLRGRDLGELGTPDEPTENDLMRALKGENGKIVWTRELIKFAHEQKDRDTLTKNVIEDALERLRMQEAILLQRAYGTGGMDRIQPQAWGNNTSMFQQQEQQRYQSQLQQDSQPMNRGHGHGGYGGYTYGKGDQERNDWRGGWHNHDARYHKNKQRNSAANQYHDNEWGLHPRWYALRTQAFSHELVKFNRLLREQLRDEMQQQEAIQRQERLDYDRRYGAGPLPATAHYYDRYQQDRFHHV